LFESLNIKKWVPDPSEIFVDGVPFYKKPPERDDNGRYVCGVTFTVREFIEISRAEQVTMIEKIFETIDTLARMQKTELKVVHAVRYNNESSEEVITFYAYLPKPPVLG